jgi:hypothetical protein
VQYHGIKFQALVTPDGMLSHLYGPVSARTNDSAMLADSKLQQVLWKDFKLPDHIRAQHAHAALPSHWLLYGDPAYKPRTAMVMSPWTSHEMSVDDAVGDAALPGGVGSKRRCNAAMSALRISVEHWFSLMVNNFK